MKLTNEDAKYVVLRHATLPDRGLCFFTTNDPTESEEEKGASLKGEHWYDVAGYANTIEQAQALCSSERQPTASIAELEEYYRNRREIN